MEFVGMRAEADVVLAVKLRPPDSLGVGEVPVGAAEFRDLSVRREAEGRRRRIGIDLVRLQIGEIRSRQFEIEQAARAGFQRSGVGQHFLLHAIEIRAEALQDAGAEIGSRTARPVPGDP